MSLLKACTLSFLKAQFFLWALLLCGQSMAADVCWKATDPRGVGEIPGECDWNLQGKSGLLCYPKCGSGFYNIAGVCWASCPTGYRDDGAFCRRPEYGRGVGYWQWDTEKCKRENKQGCEQWGAFIYPKCQDGFENVGCCICKPKQVCPSGWTEFAGSCAKPSKVVPPITPKCHSSKDYDAGLCYNKCKPGYYGIGPVCWSQCPKGWTDCGAMCGKDPTSCAFAIGDMVLSVGQVVADAATLIASFGTSAAAQGAKAAARASAGAALKAMAKKTAENLGTKFLSMSMEQKKSTVKQDISKKYPDMPADFKDLLGENIPEMAAKPETFDYVGFLIDVEPTGLGKAIKSFIHDICPVDPSIPAKILVPSPPLGFATGPDPCGKLLKDSRYESVVKTPANNWTPKQKEDAVGILSDATGTSPPTLTSWQNEQLYTALTADCHSVRKLPAYKNLSETRAQNWTEDQRNAAITIVSDAFGPAKDKASMTKAAEKLTNVELVGFLRGRLLFNELAAIGPFPTACSWMIYDTRYRKVIETIPATWPADLRNIAIDIVTRTTDLRPQVAQSWDNIKLFKALTGDCTIIPKNNLFTTLMKRAEEWNNDMRTAAINILSQGYGLDTGTLHQLTNEELRGFLIGGKSPKGSSQR